jgi:hypothetical protein
MTVEPNFKYDYRFNAHKKTMVIAPKSFYREKTFLATRYLGGNTASNILQVRLAKENL